MKKQLITIACAALTIVAITGAQAAQISGSINFSGDVDLNGDVDTATEVTFGGATVTSGLGNYAGTAGSSVTFYDFTFAPFSSPTPFLWEFESGGLDYSLTAETLTLLDRNPGSPLGSIELRGTGTASITGFENTPGFWVVTLNTADNGVSFSFSASSSATPRVPDGGATVMLLGAALTGLALFRKKLIA